MAAAWAARPVTTTAAVRPHPPASQLRTTHASAPPGRPTPGLPSPRHPGKARARPIAVASSVEGPSRPIPPPRQTTTSPARLSPTSPAISDPRFTLVRVPGDGSCLFRSLAQGHHALEHGGALLDKAGLLSAGFSLRRAVCAALVARRSQVEPFLECPFPAYIETMSLEGTWGGEPELAVSPFALGRAVCVYAATARGPLGGVAALRKVSSYGADAFPGVPPVCVLFSGAHYDLLLQQQ